MKKLVYNINLSLLLLLIIGSNAFAQKFEHEKKISKSYTTSSSTSLSIENKFGDVHIHTNNGNTIKVDISIIAKGRTQEISEKMLENIDVQINEGTNISFKTIINSSKNNWGNVSTFTAKENKNAEYEINYIVSMPQTVPLDLNNKFGAIYLGDFKAALDLDLGYGNLKAGKIYKSSSTDIKVSFGKADIDYMESGDLKISYSDLKLSAAKDIQFEGKYGSFDIGNLSSLSGSTAYSNVNIGNLSNSLELSSKYDGNLKISDISSAFKNINISCQFSSVELDFVSNASFSFTVDTKFGKFKMGDTPVKIHKEIRSHTSESFEGVYGNGSGAKVNVTANYGNVSFK